MIELEYTCPIVPGAVAEVVDVQQTSNGAIAASPLGIRTIDTGLAGSRTIAFYFEAKKAGSDTVTLVIDDRQYAYHFQVEEPEAVEKTAALHSYPYELNKGDKLSDGPGKSFDINEPTLLIWVDLQPGRRFAHNTRYVLVTATGMRSEQGQWWPVLNSKPLRFLADRNTAAFTPPDVLQGMVEGKEWPAGQRQKAENVRGVGPGTPPAEFKFVRAGNSLSPVRTSPDGKISLELYREPRTHESAAQLVEVATGKRIGRPILPAGQAGAERTFTCWSFSPDGKYVATGSRFYRRGPGGEVTNLGRVEVWDAATGSRVAECGGGSDAAPRNQADGRKRALGSILSVAFTRDGREVLFISEDYRDDDGGK